MIIIMQLYKTNLRINLIIVLMFFLSSNVRAHMDVNWDVQGKDYKWTIVSATVTKYGESVYDCGNILTGNMCVVEFVFGNGPSGSGSLLLSKDTINMKGKKKMKDVVAEWSRSFIPKSGVIYNLPYYMEKNPGGDFLLYLTAYRHATIIGSSKDGFITPPPPVTPEPPPVSCSIDGNIDLPHGILNADEVSGNVKTVATRVTCNRQATVKVTARANSGGDVVNLRSNGSLRSQLKVNNANGSVGSTFTVPGTSGTSVNISSTLVTSGDVAPGTFSGSGVAVLSIQ